MSWNYRIIRKKCEDCETGYSYGIHEVFYDIDRDGKNILFTLNPVAVDSESLEGALKQYEWMKEAFEKSVIDYDTQEELTDKPLVKSKKHRNWLWDAALGRNL